MFIPYKNLVDMVQVGLPEGLKNKKDVYPFVHTLCHGLEQHRYHGADLVERLHDDVVLRRFPAPVVPTTTKD